MVTIEQIATQLGIPTPAPGSVQAAQWVAWIEQARDLITERAADMGRTVDTERADRVILLAVVKMARRPDGIEQVDVAVDDGRVSRRYSSSTGEVAITDDWWRRLGLSRSGGAFNIRLYGSPDRGCRW